MTAETRDIPTGVGHFLPRRDIARGIEVIENVLDEVRLRV